MGDVGERIYSTLVSVIVAIIGVAIISVILSNRSNTAGVLKAGGDAFSNILNAAFGGAYGSSGFSFNSGGFGFNVPGFNVPGGSITIGGG